jgi:hypothetical protein
MSAADLVDQTFLAYNGGRLREAAKLLTEKMLPRDGVIGLSLTGALTPAGLGKSCLIPLMRAGFVDWIVSTGANLYHDLHYGLGMALHQGSPFLDDVALHRDGVIRIYDILLTTMCCWTPTPLCARSSRARSSSGRWARTNFIICSANTSRSAGANSGSRTVRCWPPPTSAACRSSPAARGTVPSA